MLPQQRVVAHLELIHCEAYALETDARRREKYLKTTEGKRFLRQQIRDVIEAKRALDAEKRTS